MARRAWYKSSEYESKEHQERTLGDGSKLEWGELREEPGFHKIVRTYPWGFQQEIVFHFTPVGQKIYDKEGPGPEAPVKDKAKAFEEALQNGEVRITARGPIPGAGMGRTYDSATRKHYKQSAEFESEFARMKLSRVMQSDHSTMHRESAPTMGRGRDVGAVEAFSVDSVNAVPPAPRAS